MVKFNVGDKVICIHSHTTNNLIKGKTYTIQKINSWHCKVKELDYIFHSFRFIKYSQISSKNDIINFINKLESML